MIRRKYICFDIGKTKILAAVLKTGRKKYKFIETVEFKNPRNPEKIKKIILNFCYIAHKKHWTKKVAISAAHLVDSEKKTVNQGKKCYGADVFDFWFLEEKGFSVRIENDGRCFALGEYHFGKGKDAKNILTMALGTGIGGGFIISGENYRGSHSSALEVSHILMPGQNKWKRWWEFIGGAGIEKNYFLAAKEKISCREIFELARNKDKLAGEIIKQAADYLGYGVASLIIILDPEMIIFGGSLSKQKKFVGRAIEIAKKNTFNKKANYRFAISTLGNKANLLGAASLYF